MLKLKKPFNGASVCLQTKDQRAFIEDEAGRAKIDGSLTFQWYDLEKQGVDRTIPLPVSFEWEYDIADGLEDAERDAERDAYFYLLVSESEDMRGAWAYITRDTSFDVYNLKIGTEYFWCVQRNGKRSEVLSFETQPTCPRCLRIEKVSNMRDLGGYSVEGGKIRQGLLYRGGEMETHMCLTPLGAEEIKRLGIRTEIDMRGEAAGKVDYTTAECLGVKRVFVPSVPYHYLFAKEQRLPIKRFFNVLANKKNYPIYFHCWGGADRTGTFAFIIGAFLGMSYSDLILEYEFTSLSVWGTRTRNYWEFQEFIKLFFALPGETLKAKATAFLKEKAGLTDKQLLAIYDTLVEKDK